MPIEIIVPRLGWAMEEGAFVAWLKQDGELGKAGEPLFSIEGDKAIQEIESIDSGLLRIAANCPQSGATVRVGDVLGHLVSAAELAPAVKAASASAPVAQAAAAAPQRVAEAPAIVPAPQPTLAVSRPSNAPVISPRAGGGGTRRGLDHPHRQRADWPYPRARRAGCCGSAFVADAVRRRTGGARKNPPPYVGGYG